MREFVTSVILDGDERVEFDRADWPLHVTVSTNFRVDLPAPDVAALLRPGAASVAPFAIRPGGDALFGPKGDIPVVLVEPGEEIIHLQREAIRALSGHRVEWLSPYRGEHYRPHATVMLGRRFGPGPLLVDRLALAEIVPSPEGDRVRIVDQLPLGSPEIAR